MSKENSDEVNAGGGVASNTNPVQNKQESQSFLSNMAKTIKNLYDVTAGQDSYYNKFSENVGNRLKNFRTIDDRKRIIENAARGIVGYSLTAVAYIADAGVKLVGGTVAIVSGVFVSQSKFLTGKLDAYKVTAAEKANEAKKSEVESADPSKQQEKSMDGQGKKQVKEQNQAVSPGGGEKAQTSGLTDQQKMAIMALALVVSMLSGNPALFIIAGAALTGQAMYSGSKALGGNKGQSQNIQSPEQSQEQQPDVAKMLEQFQAKNPELVQMFQQILSQAQERGNASQKTEPKSLEGARSEIAILKESNALLMDALSKDDGQIRLADQDNLDRILASQGLQPDPSKDSKIEAVTKDTEFLNAATQNLINQLELDGAVAQHSVNSSTELPIFHGTVDHIPEALSVGLNALSPINCKGIVSPSSQAQASAMISNLSAKKPPISGEPSIVPSRTLDKGVSGVRGVSVGGGGPGL